MEVAYFSCILKIRACVLISVIFLISPGQNFDSVVICKAVVLFVHILTIRLCFSDIFVVSISSGKSCNTPFYFLTELSIVAFENVWRTQETDIRSVQLGEKTL